MPRFAANLSMLYTEHDFLDRFEAAARDGFEAVEFLFPYGHDAAELAARLKGNGLRQVLFNAPPGDWAGGERGLACLPGREAEFRAALDQALRHAEALDCPRVHVMAGRPPAGLAREAAQALYVENLRWAAAEAAKHGRELLIEPINPQDMPGYFLNRQDHAHAVVQAVGAPNLKVQMDLYHCRMVEGDVLDRVRRDLPTGRIGHFQIAGVPGRHEPDVGGLGAAPLLRAIDETAAACGWQGWIGCEYHPARGAVAGGTSDGLGWLRAAAAG